MRPAVGKTHPIIGCGNAVLPGPTFSFDDRHGMDFPARAAAVRILKVPHGFDEMIPARSSALSDCIDDNFVSPQQGPVFVHLVTHAGGRMNVTRIVGARDVDMMRCVSSSLENIFIDAAVPPGQEIILAVGSAGHEFFFQQPFEETTSGETTTSEDSVE
jgi:hypothetical protein